MKKNLTIATTMIAIMFSACQSDDSTTPNAGSRDKVVKASVAGYYGTGQTLEGENAITDLQACIFEDGYMTAVFKDVSFVDNSFNVKVDEQKGTMYVVANADSHLNLDSLKESGITEDEWLRLTVAMERGGPAHFFSGSVNLLPTQQTVIPVTLKRGVARFDLRLRTAGKAQISGITFRKLAQSAYLFPAEGEHSPADVTRNDTEVVFEKPLTSDTPAIIYVYEQENDGIEVEVDAVIDGKPATLTKVLSGHLKRNTIYTLTVRKDDIDVTLDVTFEDWAEGEDTELTPAIRHL